MRLSAEQKEEILADPNIPGDVFAVKFGCHPTTVNLIRRKAGLKKRKTSARPEKIEPIEEESEVEELEITMTFTEEQVDKLFCSLPFKTKLEAYYQVLAIQSGRV